MWSGDWPPDGRQIVRKGFFFFHLLSRFVFASCLSDGTYLEIYIYINTGLSGFTHIEAQVLFLYRTSSAE